ncbi:hypothetical protein [Pyrococcus horikoshii]|uniref:hypothetical protein n=1 Tax=Pyrococcus horikoshii TaxID=53953 RepID=UPI000A5758EE|nr:hypothetical protein [Pyrococcus horikoshii]
MMNGIKEIWSRNIEFNWARRYECAYAMYLSPLYADLGFLGDKLLVAIDNKIMLYDINGTLLWSFKLVEILQN